MVSLKGSESIEWNSEIARPWKGLLRAWRGRWLILNGDDDERKDLNKG